MFRPAIPASDIFVSLDTLPGSLYWAICGADRADRAAMIGDHEFASREVFRAHVVPFKYVLVVAWNKIDLRLTTTHVWFWGNMVLAAIARNFGIIIPQLLIDVLRRCILDEPAI